VQPGGDCVREVRAQQKRQALRKHATSSSSSSPSSSSLLLSSYPLYRPPDLHSGTVYLSAAIVSLSPLPLLVLDGVLSLLMVAVYALALRRAWHYQPSVRSRDHTRGRSRDHTPVSLSPLGGGREETAMRLQRRSLAVGLWRGSVAAYILSVTLNCTLSRPPANWVLVYALFYALVIVMVLACVAVCTSDPGVVEWDALQLAGALNHMMGTRNTKP
jgi:hypothetical protein